MNQQQLYAVLRTNGTVRLAAGPGSGKTRVLTARIAHLIHTERVPPSRVLALTFTNKAARELRERITALLGPAASDQVTMGTFHSLCLSMLRNDIERLGPELPYRRGFAVYDADEALKLVRQLLAAEGRAPPKKGAAVPTLEREGAEASQVQSAISYAKNRMLNAASFAAQYGAGSIVARVFARYEAELRARNVVDFDDMLTLSVALLRDVPEARAKYQRMWSHMHVDEFQDTNSPQYRVLALLGGGHSNVFAVGDADQAIYGWRGADAANQARLDDEFCVLEGPSVPAAPLPPSAFDSGDALRAAVPALLPGLDCARPPADDAARAAAAAAAADAAADGRRRRRARLRLELNYRSTQPVLDAAMALAARVRRRRRRRLCLRRPAAAAARGGGKGGGDGGGGGGGGVRARDGGGRGGRGGGPGGGGGVGGREAPRRACARARGGGGGRAGAEAELGDPLPHELAGAAVRARAPPPGRAVRAAAGALLLPAQGDPRRALVPAAARPRRRPRARARDQRPAAQDWRDDVEGARGGRRRARRRRVGGARARRRAQRDGRRQGGGGGGRRRRRPQERGPAARGLPRADRALPRRRRAAERHRGDADAGDAGGDGDGDDTAPTARRCGWRARSCTTQRGWGPRRAAAGGRRRRAARWARSRRSSGC